MRIARLLIVGVLVAAGVVACTRIVDLEPVVDASSGDAAVSGGGGDAVLDVPDGGPPADALADALGADAL